MQCFSDTQKNCRIPYLGFMVWTYSTPTKLLAVLPQLIFSISMINGSKRPFALCLWYMSRPPYRLYCYLSLIVLYFHADSLSCQWSCLQVHSRHNMNTLQEGKKSMTETYNEVCVVLWLTNMVIWLSIVRQICYISLSMFSIFHSYII